MKAILFIATPHKGSDVVEDTKKVMKNIIPGYHYLGDLSDIAIPVNEFCDSFFNSILLSKTTEYLCRKDKQFFDKLH